MAIIFAAGGLCRCSCCHSVWSRRDGPLSCSCACSQQFTLRHEAKASGPGTELKALLKDWLGIESSPTCSCNAMARKMNERGPEWCESDEGMDEILGVMRAEHAKRWANCRTLLPWTDMGARQLVRLACRRARAKASA